jgi:hypothetical protein
VKKVGWRLKPRLQKHEVGLRLLSRESAQADFVLS